LTQVIEWTSDSGDGVCIGGNDPNDQVKPFTYTLRTMSKFFNLSPQITSHLNTLSQTIWQQEGFLKPLVPTIPHIKMQTQYDETDAVTKKFNHKLSRVRDEITGSMFNDTITIDLVDDSDAYSHYSRFTDVYGRDGDDTITTRAAWTTFGVRGTAVHAYGEGGKDSFIAPYGTFMRVMDMEVGETITVDGRYNYAKEDPKWGGYFGQDTNMHGREFINFGSLDDIGGRDSVRTGVWLSEGTGLHYSVGANNTSVFTLVEI